LTPALQVSGLTKTFPTGKQALRGLSLRIEPGEMVALIGASGSGKSTLLRHVGGLTAADRQQGGGVEVFGRIAQDQGRVASDIRRIRSDIGFVFQQFNLVGRLSVLKNVLAGNLHRMPSWRSLPGWFSASELGAALDALDRVGMRDCALQRASTLSGGQQQRAAIARTLVQKVRLLLADEPIASLDPESARRVMEILAEINRVEQCTILISLHQVDVALKYCARVIALRDGRIVYDGPSADLTPAMLREIYGEEAGQAMGHPVPAVVAGTTSHPLDETTQGVRAC